ncbi:hypothetical protein ACOMHN_012529 [Nucella lapillus]
MVLSAILRVMSLTLLVTLCQGQGRDSTTSPGSFGPEVVNAVVNRIRSNCIFSGDLLFLRRTAYVMSRYGYDSVTYRPGFDGGIWQITKSSFLATKQCRHSSISEACSNIRSNLKIDWSTVTWSDLRKPLYSGIAAALYSLLTKGRNPMAGDISAQAILWAQMYKQDKSIFVTKAAQMPEFSCKDKLDLTFILDSSGSVTYQDFKLMRKFAASVVDAMNVSSEAVRIADIVYGTAVKVFFDFNDNGDVKSKLLLTNKVGGGTNTAAALDTAKATLYNYGTAVGARKNVKKVAILVTDGRSNSFTATVNAAKRLKDAGTTIFAIGVGNYLEKELKAVASDPICSHVQTLTSFAQIQSIVTEIQKSTCEANIKLSKGFTTTISISTDVIIETPAPPPNKIIEVKMSCGVLWVYTSMATPKPGPSMYGHFYLARPGVPTYLHALKTLPQGTRVYVRVLATHLPKSAVALRHCSDYSWTLSTINVSDIPRINVICEVNGKRHACTRTDIANAGLCPNNDLNYPLENPCTRKNLEKGILRFPHPYDPTKFLQCDMQGRYYISQCPGGAHFILESRACSFSPSTPSNPTETPGESGQSTVKIESSCTPEVLAKHQYYHAYAADAKKFIQCDAWGNAFLRDCAAKTVWSQQAYTCIHAPRKIRSASRSYNTTTTIPASSSTTTTTISSTSNPTTTTTTTPTPCTHHGVYPEKCDRSKYYICNNGKLVLMECPFGLQFNSSANYCDWPSANPVPLPASCLP